MLHHAHPTRYGDAHLSNEASVPTPQAAAMRSRLPSGPWLAVIAAVSWIAVCLAAVGWFYLRSVDPAVCPADGEYPIFCRAHQADLLLGDMGKVGVAFVLGAVLLAAIVMFAKRPAASREHSRGQAMVEMALIIPTFFFLLFGVIEFGLLMFDVTTTRFAAGEAARVVAQVGDTSARCSDVPGCAGVYGPTYATLNGGTTCDATCQGVTPPLCNADCQAIVAIHRTALGSTTLEKVNYIEVQKMQSTSATPAALVEPPAPVTGACQRYNMDGSAYTSSSNTPAVGPCFNYQPQTQRNTITGQQDYFELNINFTYRWLTGIFSTFFKKAPTYDSIFLLRLEPQKFATGG